MTPSMQASIELIERGLLARPVGLTLRAPPPIEVATVEDVDLDSEPFRKALPQTYPRPCAAKCGVTVTYPGVCTRCGDAVARANAEIEFGAALDSIPDRFRWTRNEAVKLDARCGAVYAASGQPQSLCKSVVPTIVRKLLAGSVHNYTIRGNPDAGKTSVACAAFYTIVDMAIDAWIAFCKTRKGGRASAEAPKPRIVTVARGARFVATRDLAPPKDRGPMAPPPMFGVALKATLLILDDIGQEANKSDGSRDDSFAALDRIQATKDVVTSRWDPRLPILGTTFLGDDGICGMYDGGVQKRLCASKDKSVAVIHIHGGKT